MPTPSVSSPSAICYMGVDVAKAEVVIAHQSQLLHVPNRSRDLRRWLKTLPVGCVLALEATSTYHQLLADLAAAAGHTVYVLNPKALKHYRTATQGRAKTDTCDAFLLARYVEREQGHLHPYVPLTETSRRLCALLRRRAVVVKAQTLLRQSLESQAQELGIAAALRTTLAAHAQLIAALDQQITLLLHQPQHQEAATRLQSIVGIGPLTAAALLVALERGTFATPEAFVAFLGLDPVACDSGQKSGRRHLSKQGDSHTRRLLFTAAMSASLTKLWRPVYERYLKRGLSHIQSLCILARKLARLAWSLHKHQTTFCPTRFAQTLT